MLIGKRKKGGMITERLNPLNDYIFLKLWGKRGMRNSYRLSSTPFRDGKEGSPARLPDG
jgi:hypothetical protein